MTAMMECSTASLRGVGHATIDDVIVAPTVGVLILVLVVRDGRFAGHTFERAVFPGSADWPALFASAGVPEAQSCDVDALKPLLERVVRVQVEVVLLSLGYRLEIGRFLPPSRHSSPASRARQTESTSVRHTAGTESRNHQQSQRNPPLRTKRLFVTSEE